MKFLVKMGPHRFVIEAETDEDKEREVRAWCEKVDVEPEPATYELQENA